MLKPAWPISILFLLTSLIVAGCSSSEGTADNQEFAVDALLLDIPDLPDGARTDTSPPEVCGPLPVLQSHGAQTGISPMFAFSQVRMKEAVGVLDTPESATVAYNALNHQERLECIRTAIEGFAREQDSVERLSLRPLRVREEGSLVRYLVIAPDAGVQNFVDIVSLKSGRCAASLLFLMTTGDQSRAMTDTVSSKAAELLSKPCN